MKEKRIIDYNKILPIIEIYPCLQGEGKYEGSSKFSVEHLRNFTINLI